MRYFLLLILCLPAWSQSPDVLRRLDLLEQQLNTALQRIAQLEGAVPAAVSPAPAPAAHDHDAVETTLATPRMTIRGFGDIGFGREAYVRSPNSFRFGQLDLYITSRLNDRTSVLMETIFESDTSNAVGVDIERVLLQHRVNRYLKLEAGRNHSAIGYYNSAFHHGTWFQTATARPFLFAFEDEGGLLPIHMVGVRASGSIPLRGVGLEYTAEAGNGRNYNAGAEAVQNRVDYTGGKAWNVALTAAPNPLPGAHFGVSFYRQDLHLGSQGTIRQAILAGYAVYDRGPVEFLNEAVWMRHTLPGGRTTSVPAGYSQLAYRFGNIRPYVRFEYLNPSASDPVASRVLSAPGLRRELAAGIRFDLWEFAAFKIQYGRLDERKQTPSNVAAAQLAFTF